MAQNPVGWFEIYVQEGTMFGLHASW